MSRLTGLRLPPFALENSFHSGIQPKTAPFQASLKPSLRLLITETASHRSQCALCSSGRTMRGTLLHCGLVYPHAIKFSLPSHYPRRHSRDKIFQAFPAFRTASDKSWVEAWERGYKNHSSYNHSHCFVVCNYGNNRPLVYRGYLGI